MNWYKWLLRNVRLLFDREGIENDMDEEMRFHIQEEVAHNVRAGMTPQEARRSAMISFGGVERFKEQGRYARGWQWLDDLQRDVRRAVFGMRSSPGFTAVSLIVLTLGIGANTAIFSVIHAVLVEPLPFAEPDRLVQVYESHRDRGWNRFLFSQPNAIDVRDRATSFEGIGVFGRRSATLTGDATPQQITLGTVTPGTFDVLGVIPLVGRTLRDADVNGKQARRVLLLSEDLWVNRYGADPRVVGQTVSLDTEGFLVVGVVPRTVSRRVRGDAYVPMVLDAGRNRMAHLWSMIARLRTGIDIEVAQVELTQLAHQMDEDYRGLDEGMGLGLDPSSRWAATDDLRRSLWIFMGSAGLLLAIACMNLANLQLARLDGRRRQVTLSLALGAGRGRIMRQLLTESALLGLLGGALGILAAHAGLVALVALEPGRIPRLSQVEVNGAVLGFALVVSLLAGIGAGLLPATRMFSGDIGKALRESSTRISGGRAVRRIQNWLVGTETALSFVLLVGAGLLIRSLAEVRSVDSGFDSEGRITFEVPLPASYGLEEGRAFRAEFLSRVRSLPRVVAASAVSTRPVGGGNTVMGVLPKGETPETFGGNYSANWRAVSDDYFRSLGLSLVAGRDLNHTAPMESGTWEVVISESLANTLWPGEDAVDREANLWNDAERIGVIVGVVQDMRERGPEAGETLAIYFSYAGVQVSPINFVVHADGDPLAVVPEVRRMLAELDPNVPVSRVRTVDDMVQARTAPRRFTMTLLVLFASLALILALAGLYGVITHSVGQRAKELSVRIALGASSGEVVGLVMRQGLRPAVIGIVAGMIATIWVSRALSALLFGVSPTDPVTYAGVGLLLGLTAAAACWMPARTALHIEASSVLREE